MAFEQWQAQAAQMKHEQEMLKKAVMRLVHRQLGMALETWRGVAAEMKSQVRAMGGALRRMMERSLSMAFERWQSVAAGLRRDSRRGDGRTGPDGGPDRLHIISRNIT